MKVNDYDVPEGLYYTKEHEWVKVEGDVCRVGVTDYAQKLLHEIVFVDLPKVGTKVNQSQTLGSVESVKAVADVFAPISGEVRETNVKLADAPELVNQQPYGDGWIVVIKSINLEAELKALLDARTYADFLKTQVK